MSKSVQTGLSLTFTLLAIAVVYLLTISPFVGGGDSGELIVTAYRLATPHPPGYPIYTALAHLFTLLPLSTIAWRVGLFSVCCQLFASGLLFLLVRRWLKSDAVAIAVTLLFSLSTLTWRYAIAAEVFALNNLFAVALLWTFYLYNEQRRARWAWLGCFVLGLACCHQLTIVLFSAPFFFYFLITDWRRLLRPRVFLPGIALFALGLTPYLFLFYLGEQRTLIGWGDLSTWDGFFTHVFRREYGAFRLAHDGIENSGFWPKIYYFLREMGVQTLGLVALVPVILYFFRTRFVWLLAASLLFYTIVFQALSNLDLSIGLYFCTQSRMWILPLLLIWLVIGWGVAQWAGTSRTRAWGVTAITLALLIANSAWNWRVQDQSQNAFFANVGHSMLDGAEPKAVILMREDAFVNALRYLQVVDQVRPDVHVIPLDTLWWPWMKAVVEKEVPEFYLPAAVLRPVAMPGAFTLSDLLTANFDRFPLYIAKITVGEGKSLEGYVKGFPCGFHSRVFRPGAVWSLEDFHRQCDGFIHMKLPDPETYPHESWEAYMVENYVQVEIPMAGVLVREGKGQPAWLWAAIEILQQVEPISGKWRPDVLRDLGNAYGTLAANNPSLQAQAVKAWDEYLATNPPETPELKNLRAVLAELRRKPSANSP